MKPVIKVIAGVFAATSCFTGLNGAAQAQSYRNDAPQPYEYRQHAALGVVESVETIQGTQQGNKVAGTILGGVIGGVLGHQIGSGRGNDAATVAGALGGAALGHNLGDKRGSRDSYRVSVRMDNGQTHVIQQDSLNGLRTGDRVRVDGNHVTLYAGERYDRGYAPADAHVPPETRQEYLDADDSDDRIEYRPGERRDYRPAYAPEPRQEYRSEEPVYRYQRDIDDIDDSGYRYRP